MSLNDFMGNKLKVVIPARYASSRFPGKPLAKLLGKPMIVRVYERVSRSLPCNDIVVAADDHRVAGLLDAHNIPCVMTSDSHISGTDRIEEVATQKAWSDDVLIVNVQGDEPLVPLVLLNSFVDYCLSRYEMEMATVSCPVEDRSQLADPNIVKVVKNKNAQAVYFSRHAIPFFRDMPAEYWPYADYSRHIGLYAYRRHVLRDITSEPACQLEIAEKLEQLRAIWLGYTIDIMHWGATPPHGVDTPEDAARVEALLQQGAADEH